MLSARISLLAVAVMAVGCTTSVLAPVGVAVDVGVAGAVVATKVAGAGVGVAAKGVGLAAKGVGAGVNAVTAPDQPPAPPRPQQFHPSTPPRSQQLQPQESAYLFPNKPEIIAPVLSAEEVQCRADLRRMKVRFTPVDPVAGKMGCGIENPVKVSALSQRIALQPAATLNCKAALAAAQWAHRDLAPAARVRYGSNVKAIKHMSAYSCRRIRGTRTLSEHGKGNALDVGAIELANGREIKVKRPGFFSFREKSFLRSVRSGACNHFTTVLGPGYDRAHADHFHFDLKERNNGRRFCDL